MKDIKLRNLPVPVEERRQLKTYISKDLYDKIVTMSEMERKSISLLLKELIIKETSMMLDLEIIEDYTIENKK